MELLSAAVLTCSLSLRGVPGKIEQAMKLHTLHSSSQPRSSVILRIKEKKNRGSGCVRMTQVSRVAQGTGALCQMVRHWPMTSAEKGAAMLKSLHRKL